MNTEKKTMPRRHEEARSLLRSYLVGFFSSVIVTGSAFLLVAVHINSDHTVFSHPFLYSAVVVLAVLQVILQALFFLHVGSRRLSRWSSTVFAFTLLIVITIVGGSLWIMSNLNYNMTQAQIQTYVSSQN